MLSKDLCSINRRIQNHLYSLVKCWKMVFIFLDMPWVPKKKKQQNFDISFYTVSTNNSNMGSFSCIIWKGGCKYGVAFVLWNKTTQNKEIALFCRNCFPCPKCLLMIGKSIIAYFFPLASVGSIEYFHQSIPPALKQIVSASLSRLFSINDHISAWERQEVIILSHSWDHYLSFCRADSKEMIPFYKNVD